MVIYFSGTGNSRYCAQRIAHKLNDNLVDATSYTRSGIAADLVSGTPWIFVAPTYAWQMPKVFADFIRTGAFHGSKDAWFVLTCGGDTGNAQDGVEKLCKYAGLRFRGLLPVVMPDNYLVMFPVPDEAESRKIIDKAIPVLEQGIERIRAGEDFPPLKTGFVDRIKSGPINRGFNKMAIKTERFLAEDSCLHCGKCMAVCPLSNIRQAEGRPVWGKNCTHCMACISSCPVEAIQYGKKSKGRLRYLCEGYEPEE